MGIYKHLGNGVAVNAGCLHRHDIVPGIVTGKHHNDIWVVLDELIPYLVAVIATVTDAGLMGGCGIVSVKGSAVVIQIGVGGDYHSVIGVCRNNVARPLEDVVARTPIQHHNKILCLSYREFSVGVIEGKALPVIEIAPLVGFYDYKNKYQAGSAVETCPAVLSEEQTKQMQAHAEAAYRAVGMQSYARFDFMMDEKNGQMYCLEANTLPGMTPTSLLPQEAAAIGMSYPDLCEHIIAVSMKKYEEN